MYRILCSAMGYDGGKSGISEYMNGVIPLLARDNAVDLLILKKDKARFPSLPGGKSRLLVYPDWLGNPTLNMLWHLFVLPWTLDFKRYDFVFLPAANRRLLCRCPIPLLATVHDLSQFHVEGKYDALRMFYIRRVVPTFLEKADTVFAVSHSTKLDLERYFGLPPEKIVVNHNGFDAAAFVPGDAGVEEARQAFNLEEGYLLYVARLEHPGKNHLNLIKAYERLPEELKRRRQLVLAGARWSGAEVVEAYAAASPDKDRVKFTGFVSRELLPGLYRGAGLYVFPSYFEGFGIPLLEAMGCGVPVVCSDSSSLPEIGGDAVLTFPPDDAETMAKRIKEVLSNPERRQAMTAAGIARAREFNWEKHQRTIIEAYEKQVGRNRQPA